MRIYKSLRSRLTLWYVTILALILIVFAALVYFSVAHAVRGNTDLTLEQVAEAFENGVNQEAREFGEESNEQTLSSENGLNGILQETANEFQFKDYRIQVFQNTGKPVSFSSSSHPENLDGDLTQVVNALSQKSEKQLFQTIRSGQSSQTRIFARQIQFENFVLTIVVAHSLDTESELLARLRLILILIVPLSLVVASFGGYFLARRSLSPVAEMSRQAAFINARNLHERLPVANEDDELGSLALSFNALLARLDQSFANQRRFMADASHELRTPIAIISGESEVTLSKEERSAGEYRESLEIVFDESRRMRRIVEDLLTLARVDAGQLPLRKTELQIAELLKECVRAVQTLAETRQIEIEISIEAEMPYVGDAELLRRMFLNLLDNAVKYNRHGGKLEITAKRQNNVYLVSFSDTGGGVPADAQPHIFERFFRADNVRSRAATAEGSGVGLGLSIARWIAKAHHGKLELIGSSQSGSVFEVTLPHDKQGEICFSLNINT